MAQTNGLLRARVVSISRIAKDIKLFTLCSSTNVPLPKFAPGAHIAVHLGKGVVRQYSLCNSNDQYNRYELAVLLERDGRGGSRYLHERVEPGQELTIARPQNFFELSDFGSNSLFIAGGIGITPIMSMIACLEKQRRDFQLHYCTKSPEHTAFLDQLAPLIADRKALIHHDGGNPSKGLNLASLLRTVDEGTELYFCGPAGMMDAVHKATRHWPSELIHYEYFNKAPGAQASRQNAHPFRVRLAQSGIVVDVGTNESIVDAVARHGIEILTSCKDGYCGTCLTRYVGGIPLHVDEVLSDALREKYLLACCARAESEELTLDI